MPVDLRAKRRVDSVFKPLSGDFLLREQFVTDPAQVLAEFVEGARLSSETAEASNQLLYSMLSNPGLLGWIQEYSRAQQGSPPSGEAFAKDFATAVAEHGDEKVILALVRSAAADQDLFGPQSSLLRAIIMALGAGSVFAGTEMSPGTGGTEMSPGTGGTEMSPGQVVGEFDPGRVFAGTEMSPGTGGTEMSPGTGGTEMSPGRFGGQFGTIDVRITLDALVDFATQLRAGGGLDISGLR